MRVIAQWTCLICDTVHILPNIIIYIAAMNTNKEDIGSTGTNVNGIGTGAFRSTRMRETNNSKKNEENRSNNKSSEYYRDRGRMPNKTNM